MAAASSKTSKTILKNEALYKYVIDTSVLPREPDCMRDLRHVTDKHERFFMQSSPDAARLLQMLIKLTGARRTLEVGVFTGYSLLATALALPDDGGKVVAVDVSREYYDVGRPFIERAGVAGNVDFREGTALEHLDALLADEGNHGAFDFAFVDADKPNYVKYHEQLLRLVRVGGVIVYDDTLWAGMVALPPDAPLSDYHRRTSAAMRDLNAMLAADERVDWMCASSPSPTASPSAAALCDHRPDQRSRGLVPVLNTPCTLRPTTRLSLRSRTQLE